MPRHQDGFDRNRASNVRLLMMKRSSECGSHTRNGYLKPINTHLVIAAFFYGHCRPLNQINKPLANNGLSTLRKVLRVGALSQSFYRIIPAKHFRISSLR